MKEIYLDHAATTYTKKEVLEAMLPYFSEIYGNAESIHIQGQKSGEALARSRKIIAEILNCNPNEIIFTGSATEANNLAIFGTAEAKRRSLNSQDSAETSKNKDNSKKTKIITTKIEHPSVFFPCKKLEEKGFEVVFLDVDSGGFINLENLEEEIANNPNNTALVSIIYGQNEIGTIQEIAKIGELCQKYKVPFHTDACQAGGCLELDTKKLEIDFMTLNGSKIYGPKGVGVLYASKKIPIESMTFGGNHEFGLRPGTHNIPNIVGFAKALEISQKNRKSENQRLEKLRDYAITFLQQEIPNCRINGSIKNRLPNNISVSIKGVNSQELLLELNKFGIYISTGSACKVKSGKASNVLEAIGLEKSLAVCTARLTLGARNTKEDLEFALRKIKEVVSSLRKNRFQIA